MFKTWKLAWKLFWEYVEAKMLLIGRDPKAFYGAVMTGFAFTLLFLLVMGAVWYHSDLKEAANQLNTVKDISANSILEMAREITKGGHRESDWRDTAQKYKFLYQELKRP